MSYQLTIEIRCPECAARMVWRHIAEYNFYLCLECGHEVESRPEEWS